MKKIIWCNLVLIVLFSSCKKNWVCTCDVDTAIESSPGNTKKYYSTTTLTVIKKSTKAAARPNCLSTIKSYSLTSFDGAEAVELHYKIEENCLLE